MSAKAAESEKNVFQFQKKVKTVQPTIQKSLLLWRIIQCQPEAREHKIRLMKRQFLKYFEENEEDFEEFSSNLIRSFASLIQQSGRHHLADLKPFIMRVIGIYRKEALILSDPGKMLSFDILFQTIQLLSLNRDMAATESIISQIGTHDSDRSISTMDREILVRNFKAYVEICLKIRAIKDLRSVLDLRDGILAAVAARHPDVLIYFLECMFRSVIAQMLLARKFRCDTLIVEWLSEYGYEVDQMVRVAEYVPYETGFLQFRSVYRRAIQSLKHLPRNQDSDEFLLRSLGNFYTSWLIKTSRQIPA